MELDLPKIHRRIAITCAVNEITNKTTMATLTDDEDRRASLPETKNVKGQVDKEKK